MNDTSSLLMPNSTAPRSGASLPRYRRVPDEAPGMLLTARDVALLEDIWRFGLLTTSQLELLRSAEGDLKLRFVSRLTLTRRLKLLFHHRYVRRMARPLAQGSQEPVYVLDREGARVLSLRHGEVTARVPSRLPKAAALDHWLSVVQVRVALATANAETLELVEWLPGSKVRFRVTVEGVGERRQAVSLIPDAGLVVRAKKRRHYAFLEVDKGTEPQRVLADKARAYIAYWQSGGFARDFSVPPELGFWVLFVAPSAKRAENLLHALSRVAGPRLIFRVALSHEMTPERIGEPVWQEGEGGQWCRFWEIGGEEISG